ncbi:MAG: nucleotidyltransferase domain-containing protein [Thermoleophilia bacterium]|nr:nucleotidyltransferase domain-containing protein [Thermoleophilia bacterium]
MSFSPLTDADIQRVVDLVVGEVEPLRIVLFGSVARGEQHDGSDIDLMVVMPEGVRCLDVAKQLYRLGIPRADFIVTTPTHLAANEHRSGLVYRDIARDGRELYAA